MFLLFCLLIAGITIGCGIVPFKMPKLLKILLSSFAAVIAFNFVIIRLAGWENMPVWGLLTVAWIFSVQVFYAMLLVAFEIVSGAVRIFVRLRKHLSQVRIKLTFLRVGLLIPAVLITSCGMYGALKMPDITEHEIILPELPPELDGMTVVHVSDIHADRITDAERVGKIVERVNSLNPDLIVLTGDMVDRRVDVISGDWGICGQNTGSMVLPVITNIIPVMINGWHFSALSALQCWKIVIM